jgi:hypothetical protein
VQNVPVPAVCVPVQVDDALLGVSELLMNT